MNRALSQAIQQDRTTYLQSYLIEFLPVTSLIEEEADPINLELEFSIEYGFSLALSDEDPTLSIPSNLLAIEYSEEVDLAILHNHADEEFEEDEMATMFEEHLEEGCPPCRESRQRILQRLEQTLKSHLSFYAEELVMLAEEKLLEADLVSDLGVEVVQNSEAVEIHLALGEIDLGELQELDIVQDRLANRLYDLASRLPEEMGVEVQDDVLVSRRLVFILRHTTINTHKVELFVARQLLPSEGEDGIPDMDISSYTTKQFGRSTISKYLGEVEDVLADLYLLTA